MHLFVGGVSAPANGPDGRTVTGSWTLIKVTSTLKYIAIRLVLVCYSKCIKSNRIESNQKNYILHKQTKRKILLRGSYMAHFVPSSCDPKTQISK